MWFKRLKRHSAICILCKFFPCDRNWNFRWNESVCGCRQDKLIENYDTLEWVIKDALLISHLQTGTLINLLTFAQWCDLSPLLTSKQNMAQTLMAHDKTTWLPSLTPLESKISERDRESIKYRCVLPVSVVCHLWNIKWYTENKGGYTFVMICVLHILHCVYTELWNRAWP